MWFSCHEPDSHLRLVRIRRTFSNAYRAVSPNNFVFQGWRVEGLGYTFFPAHIYHSRAWVESNARDSDISSRTVYIQFSHEAEVVKPLYSVLPLSLNETPCEDCSCYTLKMSFLSDSHSGLVLNRRQGAELRINRWKVSFINPLKLQWWTDLEKIISFLFMLYK